MPDTAQWCEIVYDTFIIFILENLYLLTFPRKDFFIYLGKYFRDIEFNIEKKKQKK